MKYLFFIIVSLLGLEVSANRNLKEKRIDIQADTLVYDQHMGVAAAMGAVRFDDGESVLLADKLFYSKPQNKLYAQGNVAAKRSDGSIYYADIVNLSRDLNKGRLLNFRARLKNSKFAGHAADMANKDFLTIYHGLFSPCRVCATNMVPNMPQWQLRAAKVEIDKKMQTVRYRHLRLEAFGKPILYLPYFSTPTPNADRVSGLLAPRFAKSTPMGAHVGIPLYLNIAKNKDVTYTPIIGTSSKLMHELEYRHLLKSGEYYIRGSALYADGVWKDGSASGNKYWFGHVDARGDFLGNNNVGYGFKINHLRDPSKTYLKIYNISAENSLFNHIYYNRNSDHYFLQSEAMVFEDLTDGGNLRTTANTLPKIEWDYRRTLPLWQLNWKSKADLTQLVRVEGVNYRRISLSNNLEKQLQLPYGQRLDIAAQLRLDEYNVNGTTGGRTIYSRAYPQLKMRWFYPLMKTRAEYNAMIEPILQLIVRPYERKATYIPNEDSRDFEISANNLFSDNRFLGLDRMETGGRMDYGLRGTINYRRENNVSFLMGQSYNFHNQDHRTESGMGKRLSDYVAEVLYHRGNSLQLSYRLRLDARDLSSNRQDVGFSYELKKFKLNMDYSMSSKKSGFFGSEFYRREVQLGMNYNMYGDWWLEVYTRTQLGSRAAPKKISPIQNALVLKYLGECTNIRAEVQRDYTSMRNLRPETKYLLTISVPYF